LLYLQTKIYIAGYLFNALAWYFSGNRSKETATGFQNSLSRIVKLGVSITLGVMVIIRCFNLDFLFTDSVRELFKVNGWYDHRYFFQIFFIAVSFTTLIVFILKEPIKGSLHDRFIIYCTLILAGLLAIRAISYHEVDMILNCRVGSQNLGMIVEFLLVYLIAILQVCKLFYPSNYKDCSKTTFPVRYI
jgi:hypothetical protein